MARARDDLEAADAGTAVHAGRPLTSNALISSWCRDRRRRSTISNASVTAGLTGSEAPAPLGRNPAEQRPPQLVVLKHAVPGGSDSAADAAAFRLTVVGGQKLLASVSLDSTVADPFSSA
jgi:hypothetical protein